MCRIDLGLRLPSLQEGKPSLKPLNDGLIGNRNIKIGVFGLYGQQGLHQVAQLERFHEVETGQMAADVVTIVVRR